MLDIAISKLPALISTIEKVLLEQRETPSTSTAASTSPSEAEKLETTIERLAEGIPEILQVSQKLGNLLPDENGHYKGSRSWETDFDPLEIAMIRIGVEIEEDDLATFIKAIRFLSALPTAPKMQPDEIPAGLFDTDNTPVAPAFHLVDAVMRFRLDSNLNNANTWHSPDGQDVRVNSRRPDDGLEPISPAACTVVEIAAAFRLGFPRRTLRHHMNNWKLNYNKGDALRQSIRTGIPLAMSKLTPKKRSSKNKRLS